MNLLEKFLKERNLDNYLNLHNGDRLLIWKYLADNLSWKKDPQITVDNGVKLLGEVNILESLHKCNTGDNLVTVYSDGKCYKYSSTELEVEVRRYIHFLKEKGVKSRDRILILIKNKKECLMYSLASLAMGVKQGFLYHNLTSDQIEVMTTEVQPKIVLVRPSQRLVVI